MVKNFFKHLNTVNKHRYMVFRLCLKCGLFWQGLTHDLSKYSIVEFEEGVKYYQGSRSPIAKCKEETGFSEAWLHHTGKNKHHHEYWYDYNAPDKTPIIPYKYVAEMICDNLAAGMTYNDKNWNDYTQYEYWLKRKDKLMVNKDVSDMMLEAFRQVGENGIDKTINKKNLKSLYKKYCIKDKE